MGKDSEFRQIFESNGYRLVFKHYRHSHELQLPHDIAGMYSLLPQRESIQPHPTYSAIENAYREGIVEELDSQARSKQHSLTELYEKVDGFSYQELALAHYSPSRPQFHPGAHGGATTVMVFGEDGVLVCTAMAYCSAKDNFDYAEGRKQALKEVLMGMTCTA